MPIAKLEHKEIELLKKIEVYKSDLVNTINELTQKRTELATFSKKTVEDLETSIPRLKKEAEARSDELSKLNVAIAEKIKILNKEEESLVVKYKDLEAKLEKAYLEKTSNLEVRIKKQDNIDKEYNDKMIDLVSRETNLNNNKKTFEDNLVIHNEYLNQERKTFERQKIEDFQRIEKDKKNIQGLLEDAINKNALATNNANEISSKIVELNLELKEAEKVIARLAYAEDLIKKANDKEISNNKRYEEINKMAVKVIADNQDINNKRKELATLEKNLLVRETNIKIAEKKIQESI